MKQKTSVSLLFALLLFAMAGPCFSFTVIFKSGKKIEGTWIGEDSLRIQIKDKSGVLLSIKKDTLDWKAMTVASRSNGKNVEDSPSDLPPSIVESSWDADFIHADLEPQNIANHTASSLGSVPQSTERGTIPAGRSGRLWLFRAIVASSYDSNIFHDSDNVVRSTGIVYGAAFRLRNRISDPSFYIDYDVAKHEYTQTDRWDRISQTFKAVYRYSAGQNLDLLTQGEISLNGSSEDRERGNVFMLRPVLVYRFLPTSVIEVYGAYRLKRFEERISTRNGTNQYFGLVLEKEFGDHSVAGSYRYERNDSNDPRYDYNTSSISLKYKMPIPIGSAKYQVSYRPRNYVFRTVELEDAFGDEYEILRKESKWSFGGEIDIRLAKDVRLIPSYEYETRFSNDTDKEYVAHLFSAAFSYLW